MKITNILSTRLTAPGSPRMGIITIGTEKNANSLFQATISWLSAVVVSFKKLPNIYARRDRFKREYLL